MTLVYPRQMITPHCWEVAEFRLEESYEISRSAAGTQAAELRDPLWRARFQSVSLSRAAARQLHAQFANLGPRSFYATPFEQRQPFAHDGGDISSVDVEAIGPGGVRLGLEGLPAGYTVTAGDFLSVRYDVGKHSLHQIGQTLSDEDDNGVIGAIEIRPPLHPEVIVGDPVLLADPLVEMTVLPGTLEPPRRESARFWVVAFEAEQVRS